MIDHISLISNTERKYKMYNLYAIIKDLPENVVVVELDADDVFKHEEVLTMLCDVYSDEHIWITYSQTLEIKGGYSMYSYKWNESSDFRALPGSLYALRTFRASLFNSLRTSDYMLDGKFLRAGSDFATFYPMMEIARNHAFETKGCFVVCDTSGPDHDSKHSSAYLRKVKDYVRSRDRYCPRA